MVAAAGDTVRDYNRGRVLAALRSADPLSRAEVGRATGLARATISSIVAELVGAGLVEEVAAAASPGRGRPTRLLQLVPPRGVALSVDLGHSHVRALVADSAGVAVVERVARFRPHLPVSDAVDLAAGVVAEVVAAARLGPGALVAATLGIAAPVDREGRVRSHAFVAACSPAERLGLTVVTDRVLVRNDADLGAVGEACYGAGRGVDEFVYLTVGSGVGAGLVLGGRLYRGRGGFAGDIGHVRARDDGQVCRCGNRGCLETLVSVEGLLAALRPAHPGRTLTVTDFLELMRSGDPGTRLLVADAGRTIGRTVADLVTMLNPSAVLVGGGLSALGEPLLKGIEESIARYSQPIASSGLVVRRSHCGERAEVLGGIALAFGLVQEHESASSSRAEQIPGSATA